MPLTYTRKFRVRQYECDAYRHLNNAFYLWYMQETAIDASADAGYDEEKYNQLGTFWLIRETDIDYYSPLKYDDMIEVKTWVEDFRRVRSRRIYEFKKVTSDIISAKAVTDWVYLDRGSGLPKEIPEEMAQNFLDGDSPVEPKPRTRFPKFTNPPPCAFKTSRRVEWRDIDAVQHVNNAVYLAYFEDCALQVGKAYGWTMERMRDRGIGIVARKHHLLYRQPAVLDDELEIASWLSNFKRSTVMRHYTIIRKHDKELLGQSNSLYVLIDLRKERPARFPKDFQRDFERNTIAE